MNYAAAKRRRGLHRADTHSALPSWREYSMGSAPKYLEVRNAPPLTTGAMTTREDAKLLYREIPMQNATATASSRTAGAML